MEVFLYILFNNIAPIFAIIIIGYGLAAKFKIEIDSLSKIYFYFFLPGLIFVKLYETEFRLELLNVFLFGVLMIIIMGLLSRLISYFRKHDSSMNGVLKNSLILYNSGNFGLPLVMLVFTGTAHATYAVSIQIVIMIIQNLASYTLGFYNAGRGHLRLKDSLKKIMSLPAIYAIVLALLLKYFNYDIKDFFLWPAIKHAEKGLIPVALITLGTQLYYARFRLSNADVYLAACARLFGGPLAAFVLIKLMGLDGIMGQVLFISSSVPAAINSALIAVEFKNQADFASQTVLTTTIFSTITLTGVIYLSNILF
ncbi:MAG TPA: AEC family transporter [Halanaerobiales bacterium]|nr:AEC family transporter [Halanaerobiales bacterium]